MSARVQPFAYAPLPASSPQPRRTEALALEVEALELEVRRLKRELQDERARAFANGREAALAACRAERETALLAAADALHACLEDLDLRFEAMEAEASEAAAQLALEAADLLAARQLDREPAAAIDAAIARALHQVRRGQPIDVRVHPDLVDAVEGIVAARQSRDRRRLFLTVIGDPTLPLGDARLTWERGTLALDRDARHAALAGELGVAHG